MVLIHTHYLTDNPLLWVCLLLGICIYLLSLIIGKRKARTGGIGALTTAVLLGREGKKVLVLEQHGLAGGCCPTFVKKGFEFDTGIHYVGEMGEGEDPRILIDQVRRGKWSGFPWTKPMTRYSLSFLHKALPDGCWERNYFKKLLEMFPQEKAENKWAFMGTMALKILPEFLTMFLVRSGIHGLIFPRYNKQRRTSVTEFLNSISDNTELKTFLLTLWRFWCATESNEHVRIRIIINHYMGGAYYPLGGSSEIAFQMIPIIERYGGKVFVRCPVSEILIDDAGRAVGVKIHKSSGDINIHAKYIISNAGVHNTFKYLLPKMVAAKSVYYPLVEEVGSSISYMTTFVGLDGSTKELGLNAGNTWAFHSFELQKMIEEYLALSVEEAAELDAPFYFISFPSAKDPSWESRYPGKSAALLITLCPYEWFSAWEKQRCKHRGEDYVSLKDKIGRQMWLQCQQVFPQLAGKMEYIEVGTPITNRHYLGYPRGEMYGLDHKLNRFSPEIFTKLRAKTDIPGLYLTGQDVMTGGFVSSLHSGVFTASAVLNRNLLINLHLSTREIKARKKIE
ncbi:hypothetical protein ACJMK2_012009 [Sinanodonta woodiana]|uniref:Amine oxidase domain-containing protein n=1 Tax=Sinanodonta woodiana TaxID=1069815 RepID=A0ABD3V6U2_SINWO